MKLIVGLGNPGKKYEGTRHNVGFEVISELAKRGGLGDFWKSAKSKYNALCGEIVAPGFGGGADEQCLLVAPLTYMNLSGQSVRQFANFYKFEAADILVICDDMNIDCGRLRMRSSGSAGGQKGLKNIIDQLGTEEIPRLRVGVGRPPEGVDVVDHVLTRFRVSERSKVDDAVSDAALGAEYWAVRPIDAVMNVVNAPK